MLELYAQNLNPGLKRRRSWTLFQIVEGAKFNAYVIYTGVELAMRGT